MIPNVNFDDSFRATDKTQTFFRISLHSRKRFVANDKMFLQAYQRDAILSMRFPVLYHFTTSNVELNSKISLFHCNAFRKQFQFNGFIAMLMRFHELDFVSNDNKASVSCFCFTSNGTFL